MTSFCAFFGSFVLVIGMGSASIASVDSPKVPQRQALEPKWRAFIHVNVLKAQPLPNAFQVTGKVTFDEANTQHLAAPLSGRVTQVYVDLGQAVRVGTPLLALLAPEAAALQADVKRAEQALDVATRSWNRARILQKDGAVSDKEAAQAQSDYKGAQLDLQRAMAQQKAVGLPAQGTGTRLTLASRQAGTVVERHVRVGQEVRFDSGDVLLTVTNLDVVWVLADLYEQDLAQVRQGDKVQVRVAAYPHDTFTGEVAYISDVLDPQTRTLKVRCHVPNAEHRLKPEMFATVALAHPDSTGLVVPTTAVVREAEQLFVITVVDDGKFVHEQPVRLGPAHGGQQQVLGGLQEGDAIVTDGALFVHHALHQG